MRHGSRLIGLLLTLTAPCACQRADRAVEIAALLRADERFATASAREGREAWLRVLADEAVIAPAAGEIVRGLPAIREYYVRTDFSPAGLSWKPLQAEVSGGGDLGYTVGTWEFRAPGKAGGERTAHGKYVTVWRKQPDGSWKVVLDIGNVAPSSAPAATGQATPQ